MSLLVIRADGGPGIGSGHLARCLALAEAWTDRGGRALLASERLPAWWADRYEGEGVGVVASTELAATAREAAWVVLDGYHLDDELVDVARRAGARTLVVADYGQGVTRAPDVVVDGNLGASPSMYDGSFGDAELLLGTRYTLLRRAFGAMRSAGGRRSLPDHARELVVALGGAPPPEAVTLLDATLALLRHDDLAVRRLEGVEDVAKLLQSVDLAISAAGSTCWELCCSGVPAVVLPIADNQRPVAQALARAGAVVDAGWFEDVEPGDLAEAVASLAGSKEQRAALVAAASRVVDGLGAARVVVRLRALQLDLRPAAPDDCERLFAWANDPVTRASSFNQAPITWEEHERWFADRLHDAESVIWVARDSSGAPVGQVRFAVDVAGARAEISVSVAPDRRGEGWAAVVIAAGVRALWHARTDVGEVIARIRPENQMSIAAFDRANFVPTVTSPTNALNNDVVQYVQRRDGPDD